MKVVFADSFFYLAMVNLDDAAHEPAMRYMRTNRVHTLTTEWVLMEVADALSKPVNRALFDGLLARLNTLPTTTIISSGPESFRQGHRLFSARPDKEWSLTDCISFEVMRQHNITEALTGDHHFEQAGYVALLK